MKRIAKRSAIAFFAALVLAVPVSAQQKPPAQVELENPADGTRVTLKVGGELKLVLDGAPLTQQAWQVEGDVGPVLSTVGQRVVVGKSVNPANLKAGQWNIFRFRAEKPGKLTLKLGLARPGHVPEKTLKYDVVVE